MLIFDTNTGQFKVGDNIIGTGLGKYNPNPRYNQKFLKDDGTGLSPTKLLNWTKRICEEALSPFNVEVPIRDGQAVTVNLKNRGISIDIVPAGIFSYSSDESKIFYDIPRGDNKNGWIVVNPDDDKHRLEEAGKYFEYIRTIIRLIKFIKLASNYNMNISSFAVETAIINISRMHRTDLNINFTHDFVFVLFQFAKILNHGYLEDPFQSDENLLDTTSNLEWYAERIFTIADQINHTSDYDSLIKILTNK
jgi:hypothetical protein